MKKDLLTALRLTSICFTAVLLLSIVNLFTAPRINRSGEKRIEQSNKELFKDGKFFRKEFFKEYPDSTKEYYYKVLDNSQNIMGYITSVYGTGFGGDIHILIAFDKNLKVLNMKMLENSETPGFGKKWETQKSMDMFVNTNTQSKPFPVRKSMLPHEFIDTPHGVSGATITFNGITSAAEKAIRLMENNLKR